MKKYLIYLLFVYFLRRFFLPLPVYAVTQEEIDQAVIKVNSAVLIDTKVKNKFDIRSKQLEGLFKSYNSPLVSYADYFVKMADKYSIDWKLLAAITGVESTFGKHIPKGSYNAYGWGNGAIFFSSWEESIEQVSKTLGEKYYKRGLNNPYKIAPVYCPPSNVWAEKVIKFMGEIDEFEKEVDLKILPLLL